MRTFLALALTGVCSLAIAQPPALPQGAPPRPATIQVTGHAQVSETPDRVYVHIGVTTQAQTADAAASQNARRLSSVISAVKRAAGPAAQLTTTQYSINPNYNYPRDGGTATIVGYTASNVVQVRLDDLRRVGPVIDAATHAGSNDIQDIQFALRNQETARSEALRKAAADAWQDAQALAGALDLRTVRVLSVQEQNPVVVPRPVFRQFKLAAAAPTAPTPVEPGAIDVDATISLTVEVAPAKR